MVFSNNDLDSGKSGGFHCYFQRLSIIRFTRCNGKISSRLYFHRVRVKRERFDHRDFGLRPSSAVEMWCHRSLTSHCSTLNAYCLLLTS